MSDDNDVRFTSEIRELIDKARYGRVLGPQDSDFLGHVEFLIRQHNPKLTRKQWDYLQSLASEVDNEFVTIVDSVPWEPKKRKTRRRSYA